MHGAVPARRRGDPRGAATKSAHHGYLHEDPTEHTGAEQRYWFERAFEIHKQATGRAPRGYRGPVYNVNQTVIDLLIEHGFVYDSSLMADDIPYVMKTDAGELYEMPVHWGTDDWPPFAHYAEIGYMMPVRGPSDGLRAFFEEFEAHYEAGGFWMPILHPFLTGRLARWRRMEKFLEEIQNSKDVWFAPLEEIAAHIRKVTEDGSYEPRVEKLPYYTGPVLQR